MKDLMKSRAFRFLLALLAGAASGTLVAFACRGYLEEIKQSTQGLPKSPAQAVHPIRVNLESLPAWRYATALAEGDFDTAVDMTLWMRERLSYRRLETGDEAAVAQTREELKAALADRSIEGNHLLPEGVEDQYLFTPGAELAVVGEAPGADDLEASALRKTLIEITYPNRETALRDEKRPEYPVVDGWD